MTARRSLQELLEEVRAHPMEGWDFGWLRDQGRYHDDTPPWDYDALVQLRSCRSANLLDLGTGGGERLASFRSRPKMTVATESYSPNVRIAARRLRPLGVHVVRTSPAPDNLRQGGGSSRGRLPFRDRAFDLVIDRNEAFIPSEVARILAPGGTFLTEQTGGGEIREFAQILRLATDGTESAPWDLATARGQISDAGLSVGRSGEAEFEMRFDDVGALVWYLTAVPWAAPRFSVERARPRLEELHGTVDRDDPIRVRRYGFWMEAHRE